MKVKTLINKLKKCPQESTVVITNDSVYINGTYKVTEVNVYPDDIVEISSDYEERLYADD